MSLLEGRTVLVVDTETTGMSPAAGHRLVEVACVPVSGAEIGPGWSSLVRPGRAIPPDATRVHGITDAMVAGAPEPAAVAARLRAACGDLPLAFHNAPFDLPFLRHLLHEAGAPPLANPVIDTLGLARELFGTGSNALGALATRLGVAGGDRAHRALDDARTTARVLVRLVALWEEAAKARDLLELAAASQDVVRATARR